MGKGVHHAGWAPSPKGVKLPPGPHLKVIADELLLQGEQRPHESSKTLQSMIHGMPGRF